jgi:hypothetical protein
VARPARIELATLCLEEGSQYLKHEEFYVLFRKFAHCLEIKLTLRDLAPQLLP